MNWDLFMLNAAHQLGDDLSGDYEDERVMVKPMAGVNHVELRGVVSIRNSYPAREGKKAFVKGSILPDGDGPFFAVMAWDKAAEDLGNAAELTVTVTGRLGYDTPKDKSVKPWPMCVIVEKVTVHAPSGRIDSVTPKAEEVPF